MNLGSRLVARAPTFLASATSSPTTFDKKLTYSPLAPLLTAMLMLPKSTVSRLTSATPGLRTLTGSNPFEAIGKLWARSAVVIPVNVDVNMTAGSDEGGDAVSPGG